MVRNRDFSVSTTGELSRYISSSMPAKTWHAIQMKPKKLGAPGGYFRQLNTELCDLMPAFGFASVANQNVGEVDM